jgi:hypothetical protein
MDNRKIPSLEMYFFQGIIRQNIKMSLCFAIVGSFLATTSLAEPSAEPVAKTVVKVDARNGRLVRRVCVNPKVLQNDIFVPNRMLPSPQESASISGTPLDEVIDLAARRHDLDPLLVHAVVHIESRYNRVALSPKGAEGLMQLIPSTARRFGVSNSFNSRENIEGGVKYLRYLQDRFQDLRLVLAAYNAGEHAVERYRGIPPYPETQNYVYLVGKRYRELRRSYHPRAGAHHSGGQTEESEFRPIEAYIDEQGRLHLRTR